MPSRDYIFRPDASGGLELVGDFDALYRVEPDPWDQSGTDGPMAAYYDHARARLAAMVRRLVPAGYGLEVGCGHGHVLDLLSSLVPSVRWTGMDISPAAVAGARDRFPSRAFIVGDILSPDCIDGQYDVVIVNQCWWYLMHRATHLVDHCHRLLAPGGMFILAQGFLKDRQLYGAHIADGFHGAVRLLTNRSLGRFEIVEANSTIHRRLRLIDGLIAFRKIAGA